MEKFTQLTLEEYLNELSSAKPVPGGGSVSAYTGALAMGLMQMVGRVVLARKMKSGLSPEDEAKETTKRATIQKIVESIEKTKRDAFQIVNLDPKVYQELMDIWADAEKREDALNNSFRLQADLAFLIIMAREWNLNLQELVTGSIKNDLLVSYSLLEAAFHGAYHTAKINSDLMKNQTQKTNAEAALHELQSRFKKGATRVV